MAGDQRRGVEMKSKDVVFSEDIRKGFKEGIRKLAKAVKITLGPLGKNVAIAKGNRVPLVTKDGVTVANHIELKDELEKLGARMVQEVANKANMAPIKKARGYPPEVSAK